MCDCLTLANKTLVRYNAEVDLELYYCGVVDGRGVLEIRPLIKLKKLDKAKKWKQPLLFAAFCPLCGEIYPDAHIETVSTGVDR